MRTKIIVSIIAITLVPTFVNTGQDYDEWGDMVTGFLLPLTYPDWSANDFGKATSADDIRFARNFRPRIYIKDGDPAPINFYEDYLPHTVMMTPGGDGKGLTPVTRELIKKYERSYGYYLDYKGPDELKGAPIAYTRIIRENISLPLENGRVQIPFTFIRFNFVFLKSGLPAKMAWYKGLAASLMGDQENWHELDIHGAIIIALAGQPWELRPVALILAQHNHFRTYMFDRDVDIPHDGRTMVSFATRSNEPYPSPIGNEPIMRRTTANPSDFYYVITGKGYSLTSGEDMIYGPDSGAVEVEYEMAQAPTRDPLYVSWISLGEQKKLFGVINSFYRNGPPGMDLMTWPENSRFGDIMKFWYVDDDDQTAANLFSNHLDEFVNPELEPIMAYSEKYFANEFFKLNPDLK